MAAPAAHPDGHRGGRTVVVSGEAASGRPAGPALRARGLAAGLVAQGVEAELRDLTLGPRAAIDGADVVVVNLSVAVRAPRLLAAPYVVVDAAGPFLVESLWVNADRAPPVRRGILVHEADGVARVLSAADLVLVAQEAQRSLVLGLLLGRGLLRPELIDGDPGLERLVAVVPFAAEPTDPGREGRRSGEQSDLALVWPGGLWDWLDPVTLVDAVAVARGRGADVTLELWGTRSPDPEAPAPRVAERIRRQVDALGLGGSVTFVDWVPYDEVPTRLAGFDVAVTLDPGGVEARFAYRTRLLQALACGVPTLATAGEAVAERAAAAGSGWTAAPGDAEGVAELLVALAHDRGRLEQARQRAIDQRRSMGYERVVGPLAAFCREPRRQRPGSSPDEVRRWFGSVLRTARRRTSR